MRLIQHKKEAYWFYSFLSVFYDKYVNPLFWTESMRDHSLELAKLNASDLKIIDVGSGTGFTTLGIVKSVKTEFITCLDQSPHQMKKAKLKPELNGCRFILGDAENISFPANSFDRYISAGSIEYWPDPQKGIAEAMRVIKPGGIALMIGPLEPGNRLGRWIANTWMLFPTLDQYKTWFQNAGFTNIEIKFVRPQWYKGNHEYGVAISGIKSYDPVLHTTSSLHENEEFNFFRSLKMIGRVLIGSIAGFIFIPVALIGHLKNAFGKKSNEPREKLNQYQITASIILMLILFTLIYFLIF